MQCYELLVHLFLVVRLSVTCSSGFYTTCAHPDGISQLFVFKPWGGKVKPEPTDSSVPLSIYANQRASALGFLGSLGLLAGKKLNV